MCNRLIPLKMEINPRVVYICAFIIITCSDGNVNNHFKPHAHEEGLRAGVGF